jgi:Zn-finger nucleic acid-binding protein
MICPVCKKNEMLVIEHEDIEIDYCHRCGGIWLDEGELELMLGTEGQKDSAFSKALKTLETTGAKGGKKCPVCSRTMLLVDLPLQKPIEIDKCPKNHGLWFDNGELKQLAEESDADKVAAFLNSIFKNA